VTALSRVVAAPTITSSVIACLPAGSIYLSVDCLPSALPSGASTTGLEEARNTHIWDHNVPEFVLRPELLFLDLGGFSCSVSPSMDAMQ